jgi:hypothetical protein
MSFLARQRRSRGSASDPSAWHRERKGLLALCVFALLFSVYLLTFSGRYHSSDEISMLAATDSLARRGAWDVELIHWMGEQQNSFGRDGLLYSRKGIGTTLAALPFYWLALLFEAIGNVQAAMLTNAIVTALTGVLVYLCLRRLGYGEGISLATALAFGLGTMAWPYARYLFSESLAGLGLMLCFYFLLPSGESTSAAGTATGPGAGRLLSAGAGLGIALLARLSNAIVAPFLALFLVVSLYRRHGPNWRAWVRPLLAFSLPVLAALAVSGWYNWLRFGNALTTGYLPEERFSTPFFQGLYGLTFSPGKGLFWYNPLLLAALVAWPLFFRKHRAVASLAAAIVLASIAFYAPWYLWWAGHAWGPRFLVTILPFAILPLAPAMEAAWQRRSLAVGLGALALVSVAVQILGLAVDFSLYLDDVYARLGLYAPATLFDPAYSPLVRQWAYLRPGNWDLAWARGGSLNWAPLLVAILLVGASALALRAAWRRRLAAWAGGGFLLGAVLAAGLSLACYRPQGDVAGAAHLLETMERPGEAAVLTDDSLYTEAFQDAYDGHLALWGVPSAAEVGGYPAVWGIGSGETLPTLARFQVGTIRLEYYPAVRQPLDANRLPVALTQEPMRLGDSVELAAAKVDQNTVRPGDTLSVALFWRPLSPLDRSYTVSVQVIDGTGAKAGQIDRLPCDGGCLTTTWQPGDLLGEWYKIPIRPDAPPGPYHIIAGMYDLSTGQTLEATDAAGSATPYLTLGSLQILP